MLQAAVDPVVRLADILQKQDQVVFLQPEGGAAESTDHRKRASDQGSLGASLPDDAGIFRVHILPANAETFSLHNFHTSREIGILTADLGGQGHATQGGKARLLIGCPLKGGDIAETDQQLGIAGKDRKINLSEQLDGTVASAQRPDRLHGRVFQKIIKIGDTRRRRRSGNAIIIIGMGGNPAIISHFGQQRNPCLHLFRLNRRGGRDQADGVAGAQGG